MRWLVAASTAVILVVAATGLALSHAGVLGTLDPELLHDASLSGADIRPSVPGTVECWAAAPLPDAGRIGPLSRCAGLMSAPAALAALRGSAARPLAMSLADAAWYLPCPRPGPCRLPALRPGLDWVIQVDTLNGIPGSGLKVPSCTPGGKLVFVDARHAGRLTSIEWGWGLSNTRQGAGC